MKCSKSEQKKSPPSESEINRILQTVAAWWGCTVEDLLSDRQTVYVTTVRHAAYTLLTWRGLSRAAIAIIMRRSKGCAIYYGLRAFSDTLDTKPFLRIQVEGLAQALGIQPPGGDR